MNNKKCFYLVAIAIIAFVATSISSHPMEFLSKPMGIINIFWIVISWEDSIVKLYKITRHQSKIGIYFLSLFPGNSRQFVSEMRLIC